MPEAPVEHPRKISFAVNGEDVSLECDPASRLIDVIRGPLGLTGTKEGCGEGVCGACVVQVERKAVRSCLTPVSEVEGLRVTTIEGVGSPERPHPLQESFVRRGAIQCGFCTPGAIMRAKSLLERNPEPSKREISLGLSGNLCRCTGYKRIIEAVLEAAGWLRASAEQVEEHTAADREVRKDAECRSSQPSPARLRFSEEELKKPGRVGSEVQLGAWEKALGTALFAADFTPRSCLHAKIVRSAHDHALIQAVDIRAAMKMRGVTAVYTAADIEGTNRIGPIQRDQPVLAAERTRYRGEAVAVVVAETLQAAKDAALQVVIHEEPLGAVFDPEKALEPASPRLHGESNLLAAMEIRKGDLSSGFAAAHVTVESAYETPFNAHAYLEPDAGVAWKDESGLLTLRISTQNPFENREQSARALGIPLERIRVIQSATGGGFGGRMNSQLAAILLLCASKLSRPVKLVMSAAENMIANDKRHAFKIDLKTGVDQTGRLVALEGDLLANTGAYASYGKAVLERALIHATGPYEIPHVHVRGRSVYTNVPQAGAMRAFGAPQISFAVENQMDLLAQKLGLDPLAMRRTNLLREGSVTATGQLLDASVGALKTLDAVAPYYRRALTQSEGKSGAKRSRIRRGVGVASIFYGIGEAGFRNPATVALGLSPDGWIDLDVGAADIGQGVYSTLALIAAEILGVPLEILRVLTPDTASSPNAGPTEASRLTLVAGNAMRGAAGQMRHLMDSLVPGDMDTLEWKSRIARLHAMCLSEGIPTRFSETYTPPIQPIDRSGAGNPHLAYTFASHVAEVAVDLDRGVIRVERLVAAHDVGRAVNPLTLAGQIEGGLVMALGFALKEEFVPGKTTKWSHYKIPKSIDIPEIVSLIVEEPTPHGPFGAKGIGEPTVVGPASAIVAAVADACGYRATRLPIRLKRR